MFRQIAVFHVVFHVFSKQHLELGQKILISKKKTQIWLKKYEGTSMAYISVEAEC